MNVFEIAGKKMFTKFLLLPILISILFAFNASCIKKSSQTSQTRDVALQIGNEHLFLWSEQSSICWCYAPRSELPYAQRNCQSQKICSPKASLMAHLQKNISSLDENVKVRLQKEQSTVESKILNSKRNIDSIDAEIKRLEGSESLQGKPFNDLSLKLLRENISFEKLEVEKLGVIQKAFSEKISESVANMSGILLEVEEYLKLGYFAFYPQFLEPKADGILWRRIAVLIHDFVLFENEQKKIDGFKSTNSAEFLKKAAGALNDAPLAEVFATRKLTFVLSPEVKFRTFYNPNDTDRKSIVTREDAWILVLSNTSKEGTNVKTISNVSGYSVKTNNGRNHEFLSPEDFQKQQQKELKNWKACLFTPPQESSGLKSVKYGEIDWKFLSLPNVTSMMLGKPLTFAKNKYYDVEEHVQMECGLFRYLVANSVYLNTFGLHQFKIFPPTNEEPFLFSHFKDMFYRIDLE